MRFVGLAERELERPVDLIHVDAIFSPVLRVRYKVEDTRVGQKTNYDNLTLEIWTNGAIDPEMALVEAAKILRKHLNPFVQYFEIGDQTISEDAPAALEADQEASGVLQMTIADLDLSVRANNCLESAGIQSLNELVSLSESDLLKIRSFGKTSLREIKRKLEDMGLGLGTGFGTAPMSATTSAAVEEALLAPDPLIEFEPEVEAEAEAEVEVEVAPEAEVAPEPQIEAEPEAPADPEPPTTLG